MQGVCCFKMEDVFLNQINRLNGQIEAKTFYIAVSGGIDSMVLIDLCLKNNITPILLHCNFNLRIPDANLDETFVKSYAKKNNLKIEVIQFDTNEIAKKEKLSIQECARKLRYNWFNNFLNDEQSFLMTGHHLNDSIETFHINTLRGTGLKGLTGIPFKRNQIIRPLLKFSKQKIIDYAKSNNIEYREDKSNLSLKYLRNNIRHEIIPKLEKLNDSYLSKMDTLQNELIEIDLYFTIFSKNFIAENFHFDKSEIKIKLSSLNNKPLFLISRIFKGYGITRSNANELLKIINGKTGGKLITLEATFIKDRENLIILKFEIESQEILISNSFPVSVIFNEKKINLSITPNFEAIKFNNKNEYLVDFDSLKFPIKLHNDYINKKIKPLGLNGSKLISDIFIDKKISQSQKKNQVIINDSNNVVAILDICVSDKFKITSKTKRILKINYSE